MWFYLLLGGGLIGAFFVLRWLDRRDGIDRSESMDMVNRSTHYIDPTNHSNKHSKK